MAEITYTPGSLEETVGFAVGSSRQAGPHGKVAVNQFLIDQVAASDSHAQRQLAKHVLEQDSFQAALARERKRAERSGKSLLLVLLDLHSISRDSNPGLKNMLLALSSLSRETDVMGWCAMGRTVGAIFTDIAEDRRDETVSAILEKVGGVLQSSLADQVDQVVVTHYIFPEEWSNKDLKSVACSDLNPELEARAHTSSFYQLTKRGLDIIGSVLGLVLLSPVFLLAAVAIKMTSKGPVFYRQSRIGQYGKPFVFLKFRSMHLNNDCRIHEDYMRKLISGAADRQPTNGNGQGVYKLTNDPRVTRVGEILRRTSMDELPQLINVLRGEMSLVGPRPPIAYEVEAYQAWHRRRIQEAKPGITGLWQVSGRCRIGFDEMVRLDLRYAAQQSLWLDLKILLLTPWAVIRGEGAY